MIACVCLREFNIHFCPVNTRRRKSQDCNIWLVILRRYNIDISLILAEWIQRWRCNIMFETSVYIGYDGMKISMNFSRKELCSFTIRVGSVKSIKLSIKADRLSKGKPHMRS